MMIRASLERYPSYTPAAQQALGEGIFWMCDGMLDETNSAAENNYYKSNLGCVKSLAEEMAKRNLSEGELEEMRSYCVKLTKHSPDEDLF
jgi:hypothetical protein